MEKYVSDYFKGVVFAIDGKIHHGGLADRLHGILMTYALCYAKYLIYHIKLLYNYPVQLKDFLISNLYNWEISDNELAGPNAFPVVLLGDYVWYRKFNKKVLFYLKHGKQVQIYANVGVLEEMNRYFNTDFTWESLFHDLFKPSDKCE